MSRGLRWLCLALLLIGMGLRWVNLDRKVYWHDEVYASMDVAGFTRAELVETLFTGQEVGIDQLQQFQTLQPDRGFARMIDAIGRGDTQHPPLFYSLARLWVQIFGESPVSMRSVAVLLSWLTFPALAWLCWELFHSRAVVWLTIGLAAVSPFHLLYAQEAREYGLWTGMIAFSSAALLRAVRLQTWSWALYSLTLVLSFYTFLISVLVAIGHGVYLLLIRAGIGILRSYAIALGAALLLLLPWMYYVVVARDVIRATTAWTAIPIGWQVFSKIWLYNLTRGFVDLGFDPYFNDRPIAWLFIIPILLLEIFALIFLWRRAKRQSWLILCLIGSTTLVLLLPDLILGGQRSTTARYLIPAYLGLQIAIAYLLVDRLKQAKYQILWRGITAAVVAIGLISCLKIVQAETWWTKVVSFDQPQMARVINTSDRPLIITDAYSVNPANIISLSYLVKPNTRFYLLPEVGQSPQLPKLNDRYSDFFVLGLPDPYRQRIEATYGMKFTPVARDLWRSNR